MAVSIGSSWLTKTLIDVFKQKRHKKSKLGCFENNA